MRKVIDEKFFDEILSEVWKEFNEKVVRIDNEVVIKYLDKAKYIELISMNQNITSWLDNKVLNSIEEYPGIFIVFSEDTDKKLRESKIPYAISTQIELARKKIENLDIDEMSIRSYIKRRMSHEMCHVFEEKVIKKHYSLWEKIMDESEYQIGQAREILADDIADLIVPSYICNNVENAIWSDFDCKLDFFNKTKDNRVK